MLDRDTPASDGIVTPLFESGRFLPDTAYFSPAARYYRFRQITLEPLPIPPEAL
jgi:hypothetical protein